MSHHALTEISITAGSARECMYGNGSCCRQVLNKPCSHGVYRRVLLKCPFSCGSDTFFSVYCLKCCTL